MKAWNFFFGAVTSVIIVTMLIPQAFGLMNFTQWGGMYTDAWCRGVFQDIPSDTQKRAAPGATEYQELAGDTSKNAIVWFSPMHNERTCIGWVRSWCNKPIREGWVAKSAFAYYRGKYLNNEEDVCGLPEEKSFRFFQR
jgi:hypothetical protein